MAVRTIDKFIKPIQDKLFPELENTIGLIMNKFPISNRATIATFSGEVNNERVLLEFSSNHKELDLDLDKPILFVKTFYKSGGNAAGVIDLNEIPEAAEQIYAALYELGFRTGQDLADEEAERQEQKRKAEEEKELAKQKRKAELYSEEPTEEPAEEEDYSEENAQTVTESLELFDRYLNILKDENAINSQIMITISMSKEDGSYKVLNIDLFYISSNMCLVQTTGISPKIDKATTWDRAKDYVKKVADKVEGAMSITAVDEDGSEIFLPSDEPADDANVGIDI